ncbi:MAG: homocysteine S-methyltransferase family protein [Chloroflexi bacterium]|jgi:homocysteine S-methyltransferase|nr:homocysteine S-methyltransferase family protein [Chloroflexota bacterium]MBT3669823.1 homocysteine S-methyltransferase family protein [Chloroflexota bacterium]MBT4002417.1 homocysteine S-methyltransferase family protein [Chloroflexota bacterium]MBT4304724.1 homocysteine S-methyltransferase family protein [Chloroflexota bacterium]MBT4534774.1 homocysteine S-methyltransferase family protein [Chloroflexota bacterium]
MTDSTFLKRFEDPRPILLDGATGTELNRRGVQTGLPLWSAWALIDSPKTLAQVHYDYLKAGAEVLTANTFRTHRRNLDIAGMGDQAKEITFKAVDIAKQVSKIFMDEGGHPAWVAGSIAPLEDCYSPELVPPQEDCLKEHKEMVDHLAVAGADLLLIETMNTIREAEAAVIAAKATNLPFGVSFVLRTDGKIFSGESLEDAVRVLKPYNPNFIGVNCTPTTMITEALKELSTFTEIPLSGYGNIGHTNEIEGWENTDDVSPPEYGQLAESWHQNKVRLIGGCCGTSPAHIQAIKDQLHR